MELDSARLGPSLIAKQEGRQAYLSQRHVCIQRLSPALRATCAFRCRHITNLRSRWQFDQGNRHSRSWLRWSKEGYIMKEACARFDKAGIPSFHERIASLRTS